MSAEVFQIPEPGISAARFPDAQTRIIPFPERILTLREERYFARIAGISVIRDDAELQLEIWYRNPNETNDSLWFFNRDLSLVVNVRGRWQRFVVSQHSDWSERMAIATLRPEPYQMDEDRFETLRADAVLIESNGFCAAYVRNARIPLAP